MTIGGAISELNNLLKAENIPFYYKPSIKKVIETIEQDAIEQRIGHWEKVSMDKYVQHANYYHKCDVCGEQHIEPTPYCPYCGAKMQ